MASNLIKPGWRTKSVLYFNDPVTGKIVEFPAGLPCVLFETVAKAIRGGYLNKRDKNELWAAQTNIKSGYVLVWLNKKLRGVLMDDLEYFDGTSTTDGSLSGEEEMQVDHGN